MKLKHIAAWGLGIVAAGAISLYGVLVIETRRYDPSLLISCLRVNPPLAAWTCKQVLLHDDFKQEHVEELNRVAGVKFALALEDLETAEKMLLLFLARGVDINAVDEGARNWTALYVMIADNDIARIQILLRHGARLDVRDTGGMTPLDFARRLQEKYPNEPQRAEVVRILEEAAKTQAGLPK
ncbi:MAG: ankyrin repeat domain-containing protein [Pseudomonadota bacterium]